MEYKEKEFSILFNSSNDGAVITGVLRLASPHLYDEAFSLLEESISSSNSSQYVLDIAGVPFMNSSGVTALSRIILNMKKKGKPFMVKGKLGISWQEKTLMSLRKLYPQIEIKLQP